jgi:hypothetical protein
MNSKKKMKNTIEITNKIKIYKLVNRNNSWNRKMDLIMIIILISILKKKLGCFWADDKIYHEIVSK